MNGTARGPLPRAAARRRAGDRTAPGDPSSQVTERLPVTRPHTATYVTGPLPATASARPSFTSRRRWASASETAMFLDP
ncbi:hypothetical protein JCM4814A_63620 [Streptomyces phaeofaciens JCM 4814]|uniref:Uncharacterized protein n=1 Tax=Streptomyces phaeofaciens TaxID=68254 RepID=A0A918HK02_9ACTN|nr:hypothetical protein GCM10010226_58670 [Streptomyces phaeofaciens]